MSCISQTAGWSHDGGNRPLDLSTLSTADKDRVILGLWADLRDESAKSRALEQRLAEAGGVGADMPMGKGALLEQLRHRGTRKGNGAASKGARVRLGRGLGLLRSRFVIGLVTRHGSRLRSRLRHRLVSAKADRRSNDRRSSGCSRPPSPISSSSSRTSPMSPTENPIGYPSPFRTSSPSSRSM